MPLGFNESRVAAASKILTQSWHAMLGRRKRDMIGEATAGKKNQWPVPMKWECWASTGQWSLLGARIV